MNTSKDTSTLTGLPGTVTMGTPGDVPGALRHARLHRHLGEFDALITGSAECVLDDFVGARADAAAGDDQIRLGGVALEQRGEFRGVVGRGRDGDDLGAGLADRGGQHDGVGLVDLARPQLSYPGPPTLCLSKSPGPVGAGSRSSEVIRVPPPARSRPA